MDSFCFKSRSNNIHVFHNFESVELEHVNLILNVYIDTF